MDKTTITGLAIIIIIFGLVMVYGQGCKPHDEEVALFAVNTAGVVAGNLVATKNPAIIPVISVYYDQFQNGTLTVEALNRGVLALQSRKGLDPVIVNRLLALGRMIGMEITGDIILNWHGVDARLLKAAVDGFVTGVRLAE